MQDVLVIGIGNPLRGDDGAGPAAVAGLDAPGLRALTVHQLGPEHAEDVAAAAAVVFVDASASDAPGELRERRLAPGATPQAVSHALGPEVVLALAERLHGGCPPAALVTIGGATFGFGEACSPLVEQALPGLRARVIALARELTGPRA